METIWTNAACLIYKFNIWIIYLLWLLFFYFAPKELNLFNYFLVVESFERLELPMRKNWVGSKLKHMVKIINDIKIMKSAHWWRFCIWASCYFEDVLDTRNLHINNWGCPEIVNTKTFKSWNLLILDVWGAAWHVGRGIIHWRKVSWY